MSTSSRLFAASALLVAACGGDAFETSSSAGAGGTSSGTSGSGTSGSGTSGKAGSGTSGAGAAGSSAGSGASSGTSGAAGVSGGGAAGSSAGTAGTSGVAGKAGGSGAAGKAGGSGAAGSGTAGGAAGLGGSAGVGGTAGAGGGMCACAPPSSPCELVTCTDMGCVTSANPDPQLADTPHDCRKPVCDGLVLTSKTDDTDTPSSLGPCDQPSCSGGTPKHADVPSKCVVADSCKMGTCVCKPCFNGAYDGFPTVCRLFNSATADASSTSMGSQAAFAVDAAVGTAWTAILAVPSATLTAQLGGAVDARSITVLLVTDNPVNTKSKVTVQVVAQNVDGTDIDLGMQNVDVPDGTNAVTFPLTQPDSLLTLQVTVSSVQTQLGIAGIGFSSCP